MLSPIEWTSIFSRTGVPTRVCQVGIPTDDLINIVLATLKNFDFNAGAHSDASKIDASMRPF